MSNFNSTNESENWLDDEDNFVTVMIIVASVLVVFGVFLVVCLCKYPSFDSEENIDKRKKGKEKKDSVDTTSVTTMVDETRDTIGALEKLPMDGSNFRKSNSSGSGKGNEKFHLRVTLAYQSKHYIVYSNLFDWIYNGKSIFI